MIGNWIKEAREAKGLSQKELSALLGHEGHQWAQSYETGKRKFASLEALRELSEVIDLKILIEKGEILNMKTENLSVIRLKELKETLASTLTYRTCTLQDMVGQVMEAVEKWTNDEALWRPFLPQDYVDFPSPDVNWDEFFQNAQWFRFEFEVELPAELAVIGVTFEVVDQLEFTSTLKKYAPVTADEWEECENEGNLWVSIVHPASLNDWEGLGNIRIRNITIE